MHVDGNIMLKSIKRYQREKLCQSKYDWVFSHICAFFLFFLLLNKVVKCCETTKKRNDKRKTEMVFVSVKMNWLIVAAPERKKTVHSNTFLPSLESKWKIRCQLYTHVFHGSRIFFMDLIFRNKINESTTTNTKDNDWQGFFVFVYVL